MAGLILLIAGIPLALERIDATSGGIPVPDGFPADFPLYPAANVTISAWDSDQQSGQVEWLTTDSVAQVVAFYKDGLSSGDWEDQVRDAGNGITAIDFRRASDRSFGGRLLIRRNGLNGVTRLALKMAPGFWKVE